VVERVVSLVEQLVELLEEQVDHLSVDLEVKDLQVVTVQLIEELAVVEAEDKLELQTMLVVMVVQV
jgi:hypothetical protein